MILIILFPTHQPTLSLKSPRPLQTVPRACWAASQCREGLDKFTWRTLAAKDGEASIALFSFTNLESSCAANGSHQQSKVKLPINELVITFPVGRERTQLAAS